MIDINNSVENKNFVISYSGGKDSTLALYYALKQGNLTSLLVMLEEDGSKSRAHSIPIDLLTAQCQAMNLEVVMAQASWADYEKVFVENLIKLQKQGAQVLITGDIDMPVHGSWYEMVANKANLELAMPLIHRDHLEVVRDFIDKGFVTKLVTIDLNQGMQMSDLGRILDHDYIKELQARGIDPCGENGEFHTTVIDGPLFTKRVETKHGQITQDQNMMYLALELA